MTGPQSSWPRQGPPLLGAPLPPRPVSGQVTGGSAVPPGRDDEDGQRGYPAPGSGHAPPPSYLSGPPSYPPPPGYQGSPPGYQQPPAGYGQAPPPGYGQAPPPGYGQPPPGYGQAPPPGYGEHQQAPPGYQSGGAPRVEQEPDIADWWQRLAARLIDGFGFLIVQQILSSVFYALFGPSFGFDATGFRVSGSWILPAVLSGVVSGLLYAGYDVYMHGKFGATGGKMLLKLKLAQVDRQPATQMVIIKRALAYPGVFALVGVIAGLGLFAFGLGSLLLVLVTVADGIFVLVDQKSRQSLHDRFAGTVVLKTAGSPTLG
ncbi:MAG: hypothetical protein QOI75_348 [Pseudonocardiales bacterium]|nr:hypothetical protein [Pseudonocardiales bacterium]